MNGDGRLFGPGTHRWRSLGVRAASGVLGGENWRWLLRVGVVGLGLLDAVRVIAGGGRASGAVHVRVIRSLKMIVWRHRGPAIGRVRGGGDRSVFLWTGAGVHDAWRKGDGGDFLDGLIGQAGFAMAMESDSVDGEGGDKQDTVQEFELARHNFSSSFSCFHRERPVGKPYKETKVQVGRD